ncbi:hypothetical protein B0H15DRAFT_299632 [Mycena belliarum]|uniref:Uncharacterized protein n=1 Tax=Mycena belliarum TaxID=1033014 RepID=A0AAD6XQP1_9AGAR|nr:hypothetical protein B0H15DRAFT_299632 [Mycena belliae]
MESIGTRIASTHPRSIHPSESRCAFFPKSDALPCLHLVRRTRASSNRFILSTIWLISRSYVSVRDRLSCRSDKIISAADVEDKDPARFARRFVPSSSGSCLPRVDRSDPQKARYHAPPATKRCPALPVDPSVLAASPRLRLVQYIARPGNKAASAPRPARVPTPLPASPRVAFTLPVEAQAAPRISRSLSPVNTGGTGSCFLPVLVFLVSQTASAPAPPLICLAPHDAATRRALTYALRCPTA